MVNNREELECAFVEFEWDGFKPSNDDASTICLNEYGPLQLGAYILEYWTALAVVEIATVV